MMGGSRFQQFLAEFSRAAFRLDRGAAARAMVTLADKESEEEKATAPTPKRLSDVRSSHSMRNPRLAPLTLKTMPETDSFYLLVMSSVDRKAIEVAASQNRLKAHSD